MSEFDNCNKRLKVQIVQYLNDAKACLISKDINNASAFVHNAKILTQRISLYDLGKSLEYDVSAVETKIKAEQLAQSADEKIDMYQFQDALELIKMALRLVPENKKYKYTYRKLSEAIEETKQEKVKHEHQEWEENEKKADEYYQKAVQYKNNGNYQAALKEIENAKFYAEKAYIKDNKYIILKNQIISVKKSSNKQIQEKDNSKAEQKNRILIQKYCSISKMLNHA